LNFIDHLCDISNELPKHPIEEQMPYLYEQLLEINKKLPCNVYLPFLQDSVRNYLICHIPLDGVKIFRTKTRCPIMLTFEIIRIDEVNKEIKKEEEDGEMINLARSKSIASMNSSMALESNTKQKLLKDKINYQPHKNSYRKADYDLSKPVLLQNIGNPSQNSNIKRVQTNINSLKTEKKLKEKNEMHVISDDIENEKKENKKQKEKEDDDEVEDIDTRMEKYKQRHRMSVSSISSTDTFNEEDINEKFKKIVNKFKNNAVNKKREANTIGTSSNNNNEKLDEINTKSNLNQTNIEQDNIISTKDDIKT